jgi:hypothetical protein
MLNSETWAGKRRRRKKKKEEEEEEEEDRELPHNVKLLIHLKHT